MATLWNFLREMLEMIRILLITHWNKKVLRIGGIVLCGVNLLRRGRMGKPEVRCSWKGMQRFSFLFKFKIKCNFLFNLKLFESL